MDIQRGDQVYYRGEVWKVQHCVPLPTGKLKLGLLIRRPGELTQTAVTYDTHVQRVEQVR